jgi:hypothetical protein
MRTAVILTGALRTIKKTIRFLKRHVLDVAGDQVDVYACLQNDTGDSEETWREWFEGQIGGYLREVVWFSEAVTEWPILRERLLKQIPIDDGWKGYLRSSGSMVEYYQLYLAYLRMRSGEQVQASLYDYVIRCRTDSIFAKPVDFHWLKWSAEECGARMAAVAAGLGVDVADPRVFQMFMSTLWSDDVLPNVREIMAENQPSPSASRQVVTDEDISRYVREGRYVLTLRKNNLYVVRRDLFSLLPAGLGTMYGTFRTKHSDAYWFNAEGQFRAACYEAGLAVYDYSTVFEEKSLAYAHSWQEDLFFNAEGELIHPMMLYCVVRK